MGAFNFGDLVKKAADSNTSFDLLPAGPYVAKIIEAEARSSSTGKPQIKTRWEVIVGPHAGFKGLWNYFTLTLDNDKALGIFFRQLKTLGITDEFLAALDGLDSDAVMKHIAGALEEKVAGIKVVVDTEYNNNKIDRINPVPAGYEGLAAPAAGGGAPFGAAPAAAPAPPSTPF